MPKLFNATLQIEEVAVGRVMRLLHNTPGVVNFNIDMGDTKHTNGEAKSRTVKPRKSFGITGMDLMVKILQKKGPLTSSGLRDAFENAGRAGASIASVLHGLKAQGLIQATDGGYVLTKKMKDRLRHRAEA